MFFIILFAVPVISASECNFTADEGFLLESVDNPITINSDNQTVKDDLNDESKDTYIDPTEAYECLNEFRSTKGVWFWTSDNENIIYYNTNDDNQLQPLEIDKGLEEVAKIRAKECAIHFEHERPDGSEIYPLYVNLSGYDYIGENLAFSYFTGKDVTEAWKESFSMFDGQGHRRSMLNPMFNRVGIAGYIDKDGVPFFVQAFGYNDVQKEKINLNKTYDELKGSFADFNSLILNGNSVQLTKDYEYKNESAFTNGIIIDKTITIDGNGHSIDAGKLSRIFNVTAQNVILKNIKFMNAYLDYANGGAIHTTADLTLINCSFSDNFAYYGSAIYSTDANLYITDCSFSDNFGVRGGVYINNSTSLIKNCNFSNNSAILFGGGLCLSNANATLIDSVLTNNSAYLRGGAIFSTRSKISNYNCSFITNELYGDGMACGAALCAENSSVSFNYCSFTENRLHSNFRYAYGGAIYLIEGDFSITSCNFTNNFAKEFGGAVCSVDNIGTILGCQFEGNSVYRGQYISNGGAIYGAGGNVSVTKCYFSNNTAENGAVVGLEDIVFSLDDCLFIDNIAGYNGAAVFSYDVDLSINDCLFLNNTCMYNGGAVFLRGGKISFKDSVFINSSASYGASLRFENAQISIINNTFLDNSANNEYGSDGGAMALIHCQGTVEQSSFKNNGAYSEQYSTRGGAILSEYSDILFKDCRFSDNVAKYGGAISSEHSNISISDSNFKSQSAEVSGGALSFVECNVSIFNCDFSDCHTLNGGAVYSYGGNLSVFQSRFTNNSAFWGGAICSYGSNSTVYDSNFTKNSVVWSGGALYACNAVNSIFVENNADMAGAIYGENNYATMCSFIKNLAYNENPVYNVTCSDCTFIENRLIEKVIIDVPYIESPYYPGEILNVNVFNWMTYEKVSNATLNMRVYENDSLIHSSKFSSDNGWTVSLGEGVYRILFSIENSYYDAEPINITLNIAKKEIPTLSINVNNGTFSKPTVVAILSNVDGSIEVNIDNTSFNQVEVVGNKTCQLTFNNISAGNHIVSVLLTPSNAKFDKVNEIKHFSIVVNKAGTIISAPNVNVTYKDPNGVLVATLTNAEGLPLSANIAISLNGVNYALKTNSKGLASVSTADLNPGEYIATVTYKGNSKYAPSSATARVTVTDKLVSVVTAEDITVKYGDANGKFIATLTNAEGTPLSANIVINLNGVNYALKTNSKGLASVSTADLNPGEYIATVTYKGNSKYAPSSTTAKVTVNNKLDSVVSANDVIVKYGDTNGKLIATLTNAEGIPLSANIVISLNGVDYAMKTNSKGQGSVSTASLAPGEYTATITYKGNSKYNPSSATAKVTVTDKLVSVVSADDVTVRCGDANDKLIATLTNAEGIPLSANIVISLNGVDYAMKTNSKGQASVSTKDLAVGEYTATITYKGNSKYAPSSTTAKVVVNNKLVSVVTASDVTVKQGDANGKLIATLTNAEGVPLSANMVVSLNGVDYALKSNSKGNVAVSTADLAPGEYTATITYKGNSKYNPSTTTAKVTVTDRLETRISGTYNSETKEVIGTLTNAEGTPLSANVVVSLNGVNYALKSNSKGQFKVSASDLAPGKYTAKLVYKGNSKYAPSSATVNVAIS